MASTTGARRAYPRSDQRKALSASASAAYVIATLTGEGTGATPIAAAAEYVSRRTLIEPRTSSRDAGR